MKVVMKTIMAGPYGNYQPGDKPEIPDEAAKALIDGGYAEPVDVPAVDSSEEQQAIEAETETVGQGEQEEPKELKEMTLEELRAAAGAAGINGSKMNKATLIKALSTVEEQKVI